MVLYYFKGLRRSGRNKDKEVYDADIAKTVASSSNGKGEIQARKRSRETSMSKAEIKTVSGKTAVVKKQKQGNKKTQQPAENSPCGVLQTRSSPRVLCNGMLQLKPNQKACLEEIGFGSMVEFKVDGIPGKLGLYVVDNFDGDNMEIKLSKGCIVLTKDMIGEMLGLKNEGLDILEGNPNRDDEMVRNWKQQYGDAREIKPGDVKMRMRKSEKADLNFKLNFIVLFTSIMGNIRQKGVCDTSILDYITPNTNLSNINWCEYVWRALKTCKKGWKKGKKDSYFRGPLTVLTMCYVDGFGHGELEEDFVEEDGDPIPNNIEGCIWMLNNYVKNIAKERKGFEKLLTAAEHLFPGNINLVGFADKYINSLKCIWGGNNSGINATMPQTQEKEKDVQGEAGCPNMNRVEALNDLGFRAQRNEEVEVGVSDIGVNEQTPGPGKDLIGVTKNSCAVVVVEKGALFGFDRQENMCEVLTQKAFESVADEVERSIEKSYMEIDDRPNFSFGVTQDFDVIPVSNNEKKDLTPVPISAYTPEGKASDVFMFHGRRVTSKSNIMRSPYYSRVADPDAGLSSEESKVTKYLFLTNHDSYTDILFKSKSGQQSDRLQMESVGQEYVETNILDTWAVVRNHMEEYRSNDSPFRLFLPTFVVDKDSFSQIRNHDGRFEIGAQHVESVIRATSELNKLKIDLVFLPVDNEGHRFVLTFDLKYGAVTMFDQKKKDKILKKSRIRKGAKIANSIVAEMLHADFGRYLYGLDHIKARNIIIAELEIGEYEWQTATLRPYAGFILMRIMETYMGKGMRNWDLRLDSNGVKLQKKLTVLCKKYTATILMSDCNVLKEQVKAHMDHASGSMLSDVPLTKGPVKIK
ncbi:hypothetical protein Tco_1010598 [Tanacetum coccineum]